MASPHDPSVPQQAAAEETARRCPPRPRDEDELPFTRKDMVRWLSPLGLLNTGLEVALSGAFGRYADKRELQAVLAAPTVADFSGEDELWLDYLADTGDGFDPTHSHAQLLAAERLTVAHGDEAFDTEHGRILVFGCDLVYPTGSEQAYRDRLIGPFEAALPCTPDGAPPRFAFLIPGNHDWYDGLTSFLRLFCQQGWLGGWRMEQSRSYFAVRLPHRWWLFGLDIQFDSFIDEPQLAYFRRIAREECAPGDDVILCTAKPSWVREGLSGDDIYPDPAVRRNLEFFERKILAPNGLAPTITVAGHLHHYARYESVEPADVPRRQKLTAGGGGAFLYPTHVLPTEVRWPRYDDDDHEPIAERYRQAATYPDAETSRGLRWAALWAPFANPGFVGLVGGVYLALAWLLAAALGREPLAETVPAAAFGDLVGALVRSPASLVLALLVLAGMVGFASAPRPAGKIALGLAHGLAHLLVLLGIFRLLGALLGGLDPVPFAVVFVLLAAVLGAVAGTLVMGVYLAFAHGVLGLHANEAFSAQHIQDKKNFLRLHIATDGTVTIYPIGVERVPTTWTLQPDLPAHAPWFTPDTPIEPHLIEAPIVVRSQRAGPDTP